MCCVSVVKMECDGNVCQKRKLHNYLPLQFSPFVMRTLIFQMGLSKRFLIGLTEQISSLKIIKYRLQYVPQ